jgi:formamidopyrimidine-DNA glycosylase
MPELPEVETIRRQLVPVVEGRELREIDVQDARWCQPIAPAELAAALQGRTIDRLDRRGKYLIADFADDVTLFVHLRMTGTLLVDPPVGTKYERVRLRFADDGPQIAFCDPRRFGTGELAVGADAREAFLAARLGVEPLGPDFTAPAMRVAAQDRKQPIKAFLLDQRRIAGVGNIYADEALFRARIHPLRPAGAVKPAEWALLRDEVVAVLQAGIDAGGSTIDDFRHTDGVYGSFQHEFLVHRRRGEPCPVCGRPIVKFVAAGRGTHACEHCQRPPRGVSRHMMTR